MRACMCCCAQPAPSRSRSTCACGDDVSPVSLPFASPILNLEPAPQEFKVKFNRAYANSTEETYRARVFAETAAEVEAHNSKGTETYRLGINQFSDMTHEEFKATMLSRRGPPARAPASAEAAAAVAKRLAKISAPPA